jgi:ABC-2 type transport system permease protein
MSYVDGLAGYMAIMDVEFKHIYKYKAEVITNLIRTLISPLAIIVVWGLVYAASGSASINGFSGSAFFAYFIISSAVAAVAVNAGIAFDMQADIKGGGIVVNLVKPMSYPLLLVFAGAAEATTDGLTVLLPTFAITLLLLNVSISLPAMALFLAELVMIYMLTTLIFFIIGCLSSVFVNINGMVNLILWTFNVLGGRLIPLNLMPQSIAGAIQYSPFYLIYYLPSATFTGIESSKFLMQGMFNMVIWTAAFAVLAALTWKASKKKVMASGG